MKLGTTVFYCNEPFEVVGVSSSDWLWIENDSGFQVCVNIVEVEVY